MVGRGEGNDAVQFLPFDPVLEFARLVAGVLANLEHRDDDNLGPDGFGRQPAGQ